MDRTAAIQRGDARPMETLNLTPPAGMPPATGPTPRTVLVPREPASASAQPALEIPLPVTALDPSCEQARVKSFDGLKWTFRNGFDRVLAGVPAAVWAAPEKQAGWERVKHNPKRDVWRATILGASFYLK